MLDVSKPLESLFKELHIGIKIKFMGCSKPVIVFLVKPPEIHIFPP